MPGKPTQADIKIIGFITLVGGAVLFVAGLVPGGVDIEYGANNGIIRDKPAHGRVDADIITVDFRGVFTYLVNRNIGAAGIINHITEGGTHHPVSFAELCLRQGAGQQGNHSYCFGNRHHLESF